MVQHTQAARSRRAAEEAEEELVTPQSRRLCGAGGGEEERGSPIKQGCVHKRVRIVVAHRTLLSNGSDWLNRFWLNMACNATIIVLQMLKSYRSLAEEND